MTKCVNRVHEIQDEIMRDGIKLCTLLHGTLDEENISFLREYFEANEYGVAIHLADGIEAQKSVIWSKCQKELLNDIKRKMALLSAEFPD